MEGDCQPSLCWAKRAVARPTAGRALILAGLSSTLACGQLGGERITAEEQQV